MRNVCTPHIKLLSTTLSHRPLNANECIPRILLHMKAIGNFTYIFTYTKRKKTKYVYISFVLVLNNIIQTHTYIFTDDTVK